MEIKLGISLEEFYRENILAYLKTLQTNPFELITLVLDLAIVLFLIYCFFKVVKGSRAWQLIKGIILLIAFWDGKSKGTKHMIEQAAKYGLKVYAVNF